jgi:hypothetical protein
VSKLIGLAGPKHCGKSTIALEIFDIVAQHKPPEWSIGRTPNPFVSRHRFAGPLKTMLRTLGLTAAQVDGDEKETPCELLGGRTPRAAMQSLGTDWGRNMIDPELWLRATMLRVDEDLAAGKLVVIDDVRFDNEAAAIRERGGVVIKLVRDTGTTSASSHASEAGLSPHLIDIIVPNQDAPESVARFILAQLKAS